MSICRQMLMGWPVQFAFTRVCSGLLLAWGGLAAAQVAVEPVKDFANEAFSNVRLIAVEKDLVGWRIQIVRSASQTFVLVLLFEGTPQAPCLTKAQVDAAGTVQFDLPPNCDLQGRFMGKIQQGALIGGFSNGMNGPDGEAVMTLKRVSAK